MSPEKVTTMILYVDLKCSSCYNKVRKLLCKLPEVRDQVFDEDKNKVIITVVCCNPEKMRDKLCCKGGKAIQSIEIPEPEPPKPNPNPKPMLPPPVILPKPDPPKKPQPVKMPDPIPLPKPAPVKMPDPIPKPQPVLVKMPDPKPQPAPVKMPDPKPQPQPQPVPVKMPVPQPQPQPPPVIMPEPMPMNPFCPPVAVCCQECYEGRGGGPCYYGYGRPVPPPPGPCYDYGYGYGRRRPCYESRCDYFSEDNPQGCSIM